MDGGQLKQVKRFYFSMRKELLINYLKAQAEGLNSPREVFK